MFVYSVITCKYTTQTRHYGSYNVTMNTNFSGIPKLRNIFGAASLHYYHYLQNEFNDQSFSLDWQMMQRYLLLCFRPTLTLMLECKIFIRNQCSGSHTCQKWHVRIKNRNAVDAVIWTGWNILTLSFWFVAQCSLVGGHQCCGGTCCLPHQNRTDIYRLNTQTRVCSKLWCHCPLYKATQLHIPQERTLWSLLLTKNTRRCTI